LETREGMTIARDGRSSWVLGGTPAVWRAHHPHQVELDLGSCLPLYEPAVGTTESLTLTEKLGERHRESLINNTRHQGRDTEWTLHRTGIQSPDHTKSLSSLRIFCTLRSSPELPTRSFSFLRHFRVNHFFDLETLQAVVFFGEMRGLKPHSALLSVPGTCSQL